MAHHGDPTPDGTGFRGDDGAVLLAEPPFGPLEGEPSFEALIAHAERERRVGVLLVRLGGHAAGVFDGNRLLVSKVDSRLVHGRHKKGGSSANRFRRRRDNEVKAALAKAADTAARVLLGDEPFDHLVLGGDRSAATTVMEDPRLAALRPLVVERFVTVPDPKRAVLEATPDAFRATILRTLPPT
jgi:peptide subunit release factor 1 (eRF1)